MRDLIRRARRFVGVVWILSWFELYLEIYRHHHVTPSLLLNPPLRSLGTTMQAQPGEWLRAVLICSALAPPLFAALLVSTWLPRAGASDAVRAELDTPFPLALAATIFGSVLCVLGTINQLVRHPPFDVDLTLRTGNGGFIVLGIALAFAGVMARRRHLPQVIDRL